MTGYAKGLEARKKKEMHICTRKGIQQQLAHAHDALEKFDDANDAHKAGAHERVKRSLGEVTKRVSSVSRPLS